MTVRTWLYTELSSASHTALQAIIGQRVFAKKSMRSSVEAHPYLVYKLGNATNEGLGEGSTTYRQYLQIYVHDYKDEEVADYTRIDTIIEEVKRILVGANSPADDLLTIFYLETSQDLDDETLNTVFKYLRFQVVVGKVT